MARRLEKDGHYCKFGTISGKEMRKVMRDIMIKRHTLKYKKVKMKPPFNESSVNYSRIKDNRRYLNYMFFASNVAMAQALIMDEPNSEADFCFGHSKIEGVIGLELTCDANHKVIPRAWM